MPRAGVASTCEALELAGYTNKQRSAIVQVGDGREGCLTLHACHDRSCKVHERAQQVWTEADEIAATRRLAAESRAGLRYR